MVILAFRFPISEDEDEEEVAMISCINSLCELNLSAGQRFAGGRVDCSSLSLSLLLWLRSMQEDTKQIRSIKSLGARCWSNMEVSIGANANIIRYYGTDDDFDVDGVG